MASIDAALGAASRVGPYFGVVSFVPSALVVAALIPLLAARPWTGDPHWASALDKFASPTFAQIAAVLLLAMFLALALHPLQYALIQMMEGYWGTGWLALALAHARTKHHLATLNSLQKTWSEAESAATKARQATGAPAQADIAYAWTRDEAERLRQHYPEHRADVMPTLLGNVLRRYERRAGRPYGLDIIVAAPHLLLVANEQDIAYVRDQRTQLDLVTRLSASCALLSILSAVLLAPCGWWMLLAVIPYLLSHVFYRGACTVAHEYGVSLQTLVDLNRRELYSRIGLPLPSTLDEERSRNQPLDRLLSERTPEQIRLAKPSN